MSPRNPVRIAFQDETGSPLGRLRVAGFVDNGPAALPKPRRVLDSYAIVLVHEGNGTYVDDTTGPRTVEAGDAIVVVPGQPHWYGPAATWSEIFFVFDGPIFDALEVGGVLDIRRPVHRVRPLPVWRERFQAFAERRRGLSQLEVLELARLLVELCGPEDVVPGPIRRARELLAGDLGAELDLRAVAAEVGLPYETFRKRFRAATGVSPAAFRLDRRIEAAQSLLRMTTTTHAAIAASLGFADEYHFAKRFRARVGISPRDYRRANTTP